MLCMNILSNLSPLSRDLFKVAYSDMIIDTAAISWWFGNLRFNIAKAQDL